MNAKQKQSLRVMLWVVAGTSVAGALWLLTMGHNVPATGVAMGGAALVAGLVLATRQTPVPDARDPRRSRRFAQIGLALAVLAVAVGGVLTLTAAGFLSQMLLIAGVGGSIGYLVALRGARNAANRAG